MGGRDQWRSRDEVVAEKHEYDEHEVGDATRETTHRAILQHHRSSCGQRERANTHRTLDLKYNIIIIIIIIIEWLIIALSTNRTG